MSSLHRCVRAGTLELAPNCEIVHICDTTVTVMAEVYFRWQPPADDTVDLDACLQFTELRRVLEAARTSSPAPGPRASLEVDILAAVSACTPLYAASSTLFPAVAELILVERVPSGKMSAVAGRISVYQQQAAHWMLLRETGETVGRLTQPLHASIAVSAEPVAKGSFIDVPAVTPSSLATFAADLDQTVTLRFGAEGSHRRPPMRARTHMLWTPLCHASMANGPVLFWQPLTGGVVRESDVPISNASTLPSCDGLRGVGGLVCDEPGLGKTLEVLALVCAHPLTQQPWRAGGAPLAPHPHAAAASAADSFGAPSPAVSSGTPSDGSTRLAESLQAELASDPSRLEAELRCVAAIWQRALTQNPLLASDFNGAEQAPIDTADARYMSRSTLVVVPSGILPQWVAEVAKWAPFLAIHVYAGATGILSRSVASTRALRREWQRGIEGRGEQQAATALLPQHDCNLELAAMLCADLVLTSFDTLKADLAFAGGRRKESAAATASPTPYPVVRSPLFTSVFHRIILDESHLVGGGGASLAARMALSLSGRYRWCVSGTPLASTADLVNTLAFLRHRPLGERHWARRALLPSLSCSSDSEEPAAMSPRTDSSVRHEILQPIGPRDAHFLLDKFGGPDALLNAVLAPIVWRNTKAAVASSGELALPPLTHVLVRLRLSAIEEQFYCAVADATRELHEQLDTVDAPTPIGRAKSTLPSDGVLDASLAATMGEGAAAPQALFTLTSDSGGHVPRAEGAVAPTAMTDAGDASPPSAHTYDDGTCNAAVEVATQQPETALQADAGILRRTLTALGTEGRLRARQSASLQLRMACLHHSLCTQVVLEKRAAAEQGDAASSFRIRLRPPRPGPALRHRHRVIRHRGPLHGSNSSGEGGGADGSRGLVRDSMGELMAGLVALAAVEVEQARLGVYRGLQKLGAVMEQRGASNPATADAAEHALLRQAAAAYREGREISSGTVISRESFMDESTALRQWVYTDIAVLSGLQRVLIRLGASDEATAIETEISRGVIAPFLSTRLRLQLAMCLVSLRDVALRLSQPLGAWLEDIDPNAACQLHSDVRDLFTEARRRAAALQWHFMVPAAAASSRSIDSKSLKWEDNRVSDAVSSDGYCCCEEYLESAEERSVRGLAAGGGVASSIDGPELASVVLNLLPPKSEATLLCPAMQGRAAAWKAIFSRISDVCEYFWRVRDLQDRETACANLQVALYPGRLANESAASERTRRIIRDARAAVHVQLRSHARDPVQSHQPPLLSPEQSAIDMTTAPGGATCLPQLRALLAVELPRWASQVGALAASPEGASLLEKHGLPSRWSVRRAAILAHVARRLSRALDNFREYVRMASEATDREAEILRTWRDFQQRRGLVALLASENDAVLEAAHAAAQVHLDHARQVLSSSVSNLRYKRRLLCQYAADTNGGDAPVQEPEDSSTPVDDSNDDGEAIDQCPICKAPPENVVVTPCGHVFCRVCLDGHFARGGRVCPSCRRPIMPESISRLDTTSIGVELAAIAPWEPFAGTSGRDRDMAGTGFSAAGAQSDLSGVDTVNAIKLAPSTRQYGTKCCCVVRRVLALPAEDRIVIATHFSQALGLVSAALSLNGITSVILAAAPAARAAALHRFSHADRAGPEASARVLLLDANTDCSGLTLTVANHVFLLDPPPSVGALAQLAGRIGRCGQRKSCFVYVLLAEGTCDEDALHALSTPGARSVGAA